MYKGSTVIDCQTFYPLKSNRSHDATNDLSSRIKSIVFHQLYYKNVQKIKKSAKMCFCLARLRPLSIGSIISKSLWGLGLICTIVTGSYKEVKSYRDLISLGKLYEVLRAIIYSHTARTKAR